MESESIAIRMGISEVWDQNTARQWVQEWETQEFNVRTGTRGENYTIDWDIRVGAWRQLSSSAELGSGNLGSHSEVVNVILWGLTSSEVELSMGVTRGVWQGSELAKVCQQVMRVLWDMTVCLCSNVSLPAPHVYAGSMDQHNLVPNKSALTLFDPMTHTPHRWVRSLGNFAFHIWFSALFIVIPDLVTMVPKALMISSHPTSAPAFVWKRTCAWCLTYRLWCWTGRIWALTLFWRTSI